VLELDLFIEYDAQMYFYVMIGYFVLALASIVSFGFYRVVIEKSVFPTSGLFATIKSFVDTFQPFISGFGLTCHLFAVFELLSCSYEYDSTQYLYLDCNEKCWTA
jgi:hypothetical protein